MNEFAQLDLLMNLYVMDYYHAPPSYHPMERNANQRRTRKAADVERAVAREPASRHLHLQETQRQAETWGSFRMEKG